MGLLSTALLPETKGRSLEALAGEEVRESELPRPEQPGQGERGGRRTGGSTSAASGGLARTWSRGYWPWSPGDKWKRTEAGGAGGELPTSNISAPIAAAGR